MRYPTLDPAWPRELQQRTFDADRERWETVLDFDGVLTRETDFYENFVVIDSGYVAAHDVLCRSYARLMASARTLELDGAARVVMDRDGDRIDVPTD